MDAFYTAFYSDPLLSIGYVLAFFAALSFVLFLRGFFSGFRYLFTPQGHAEHMDHHRVRSTWAVLLLFTFFTLWECIRAAASWLTGSSGPSLFFFEALGVLWLVFFVLYQLVIKKT